MDRIEAEKGDLGEGIKVRDFGDKKAKMLSNFGALLALIDITM